MRLRRVVSVAPCADITQLTAIPSTTCITSTTRPGTPTPRCRRRAHAADSWASSVADHSPWPSSHPPCSPRAVPTARQLQRQTLGLTYNDVDHLILTHRHGDHAGSTGAVMEQAVNATVYAGEADLSGIDYDTITGLTGGEDIFGFEALSTPSTGATSSRARNASSPTSPSLATPSVNSRSSASTPCSSATASRSKTAPTQHWPHSPPASAERQPSPAGGRLVRQYGMPAGSSSAVQYRWTDVAVAP